MDLQKAIIQRLLAYAAQRDVPPQELCALADISLQAVQHNSSTPLALRPQQLEALWQHACALSKDALFGLHLGESMQATALGAVGLIIQHSATVGEALTQAAGFTHLITDLFGMQVSHDKLGCRVEFIPFATHSTATGFAFRQMMDLFMAYTLHELDGLVLEKISPLRVKMPVTAEHLPEYQRVLRCHTVEHSPDYVLDFAPRLWELPILSANYELQQLLLQKVSALQDGISQIPHLRTRLSSYLLANAYLGIPTLEDLAANFNTSARTLQRRLQEEGITYQQLAEGVRKSLALHYLASGTYPIKEISYILGYNELSAFTRAFKRWTGSSPANYQKN
ncbi:AraC family transcriptional regulator [Chitinophaga agrisoli]|uniref:AraC family transcriptional regulator n=1 Tax=Chitinophaga agrisoli TaxID=2607653 RepID=A0A5B2VIM0_9BACT|nr:AraC family transcriptional regulator [Chitinophaga agrisoli]KAA2238765.1 AraC family transcriptional regulator [Chitinophaga agrisoli]